MANNNISSQRTKCTGKRRSQSGFWIWCTLLKCLASLPCIFSSCHGIDLSVRLYPNGTVPIKFGDPLRILCIVENNKTSNYTSKDLEFTYRGYPMATTIVNETTIELYIEKPEKQVSTYYCKNKQTNKKCTSRALVDTKPDNVTDFKCISMNLEILNCSWTAPKSEAAINYSLTFLVNNVAVPSCHPMKQGSMLSCIWNKYSSEPRYRQLDEEYYFMLNSSNVFGYTVQNFTLDHFSVVKPDPPQNLKLERLKPHSVVLKWELDSSIKNLLTCGVDHKIEYQIAKIDNRTYFHSVNASNLPPNNQTYRFLLKNLPYAYMQYEVRIYIKSKKDVEGNFWSAFTYKVFSTPGERPKRPPELVAGAFDESKFTDHKIVRIYWKQLEEYEEAGTNFTYKVDIVQGSRHQTVTPDKNKSLSYVAVTVPMEPMYITVWSKNDNGTSENSSHLYIPALADESLRVTTFTQLAYEFGTYKLSWVGKQNISNYTVFWCQYNVTYTCAGRMNFTVLNASENSYEITLPKDHRYQFAIAANNGTKTSGIVWATCAISKDSIPMYGFPVTLLNDAPRKSYVRVSWTMTCTLQERIITGYVLKYCVVANTSNVCDPAFEKKSAEIHDPDQKEMTVKGLFPHKTYLFALDLNTTYGVKTVNASRAITTTEDTPTVPRNISIDNVDINSLVISWDPPSPRNGIIGHYAILDHEDVIRTVKVEEDSKDVRRRSVVLDKLISFKNYSLSVQACNTGIHSCSHSNPKNGIFVRTKIGPPSKLSAPIVNNNPDHLKWSPPEIPGGTVDLYQIRKVKDDAAVEILNSTNLSYDLILCEGVVDRETYEVRAVNFDNDVYSGAIGDPSYVKLAEKIGKGEMEHAGDWSDPSSVTCHSKDGLTMTLIFMTVFALLGIGYGTIKLYKKYRKMGDIKPVLPDGLNIPDKEISKYSYGGWPPVNKDEKPSSDEMLLLPNSKGVVPSPEVKQKDNSNCGSSDHTDSTALSDTSRGAVERQTSSDNSSNSSLNLEVETVKVEDSHLNPDGYSLDNSDLESLQEHSPYFTESFKKDPLPVVNPNTGYVEAVPTAKIMPQKSPNTHPAGSSYVMASLSPPIFTTGMMPASVNYQPPTSSGYVRHDDAQIKSMMNLPNLGLSPTKALGPESLPTMPSLPQPAKHDADSSYIQLQSLDVLPSLKPAVRNTVPLKPQATSGYVSPNDPMINKHLNMISPGHQPVEESAILDPMMSPDAYCRFSWSNDPAKDNLHTFYSSKN